MSANQADFLSEEQKLVHKAILRGSNVFVTGGAGVGKSFLLNFLKKELESYDFEVTASTGVAAVNVGGRTINSWLGMGAGNLPTEQIIKNLEDRKFSKLKKKIIKTKILAIDEISMISAKNFELIDKILRAIRNTNKPMGGIQLILFGDFLQLPPVEKTNSVNFCFESKIWSELNIDIHVLKTSFRHKNNQFIALLNNIRFGCFNESDKQIIAQIIKKTVEHKYDIIKPTILTTHNSQAEFVNEKELKNLPNSEFVYNAESSGPQNNVNYLINNSLVKERLVLKKGAQVMMIKNYMQKEGIINGSKGIVIDFSLRKNYPIVEFENGKILTIQPDEWKLEKFNNNTNQLEIEAAIVQIPLVLAWAITIHKSQGLTIDKIFCDLSNSFSYGQIYVALSRARNIESIYINSLDYNKIKAHPKAVEFYNKLNKKI